MGTDLMFGISRSLLGGLLLAAVLSAPSASFAFKCEDVMSPLRASAYSETVHSIRSSVRGQKLTDEKRDQLRERHIEALNFALSRVRSPKLLFEVWTEAVSFSQSVFEIAQALRDVDLLKPLRGDPSWATEAALFDVRYYISNKQKHATVRYSSGISWIILDQALRIHLTPSAAKQIFENLTEAQQLQADFLHFGTFIDRTLIASIEALPIELRQEFDRDLNQKLSSAGSKDEKRSSQFLKSVLHAKSLQTLMRSLTQTKKIDAQAIAKIETYLQKLRGTEQRYGLASVIEMARSAHATLTSLEPKESFEIFGSFPNLAAKFPGSDIDVSFSRELDEQYHFYFADPTRPRADVMKQNIERLEMSFASALGVTVTRDSALLSVSLQQAHVSQTEIVYGQREEDHMRYLVSISPVTIVLRANGAALRIYDGITPPPGHPPTFVEMEI